MKHIDLLKNSPKQLEERLSIHGYSIESSQQIGFLAKKVRADKNLTIYEKAEIVNALKQLQISRGMFPYDRYVKYASNKFGEISTRSPDNYFKTKNHIVWGINHYLGLNRNEKVIKFAKECLEKYGTGCGTSAVSGGLSDLHRQIEVFFNTFWGKEESMIFPTGYTTNLGAISSLASSNDLIIFDRECHASIIDGIKLSGAERVSFKHNNVLDLEQKLKKFSGKYKNIIVIIETVYSMSGEEAPVEEIVNLKGKYKFLMYVDEAHSFGIYGKGGRGLCAAKNVIDKVDVLMTTLSKATASVGGIISTSRALASYIQCQSNSLIFQASISPADAGVVIKSLEILSKDESYRNTLWKNTIYFRKKLLESGFDCGASKSPIVPIYIKDPLTLALFCREIYSRGVFTNWISYPVVKVNDGRLRFSVTSRHTKDDIDKTLQILVESFKEVLTRCK
jgi:glycine C-acetyltransferase